MSDIAEHQVPAKAAEAMGEKKKKKKKKTKSGKSSVASATLIVKRLMELAAEPDSRSFIVKDGGCLAGLVKYLKHKNETVYTMAASTIRLLAQSPENRTALCEAKGLLNNLIHLKLAGDGAVIGDKARAIASDTLDTLQAHINKQETEVPGFAALAAATASANAKTAAAAVDAKLPQSSKRVDTAVADENRAASQNTAPSERTPGKPAAPVGLSAFPREKRKVRTHTLKITGMEQQETRTAIERALIRLKGVVSVTLDRRKSRAVIVTRSADDLSLDLCAAINAVEGASARLRKKKKKKKKESKNKADDAEASGYLDDDAKAKNEGPSGYLDDEEDDDPFGEDERGVLSKFGSSSLHSRLAAQRQREEQKRKEQERAQGYISKVGNAIGWGASWIGL